MAGMSRVRFAGGVMKVFRDLYVFADANTMADVVAEMEKTCPVGWSRDKAAEGRAQAFLISSGRINYCFACKSEKRRPAATVTLLQKDPETFYVSNIVPREQHQLEHDEYNAVLEDFYEKVLKPQAERAKLRHSFSGAEAGLERWMNQRTAELLRSFSAGANRGTGASHPSDRERWNAFMLSAHWTDSKLYPSALARWLVEVEEWSPVIAEQLALEYESGRRLLSYATTHKAS